MKVNLGDKVKDKVSGFVGIATGRSEFLHGCIRICVTPQIVSDGKPVEGAWFDEPQLDVVEAGVITIGSRDTGGPMPSVPTRSKDATR